MSDDYSNYLVWLDLEMTGLVPKTHRILEIATIITDSQLTIIAEGPNLVIHQPPEVLALMDDFVTKMHTSSGLIARVQQSTLTEQEAEQQTLDFLTPFLKPQTAPLCGNSIWKDRHFLAEHMPHLEQFFHYRLIDVSTLKELARRWAPSVYENIQKQGTHLALQDIRESIAELNYYKEQFIKVTK
jgi:oligoribonuclease